MTNQQIIEYSTQIIKQQLLNFGLSLVSILLFGSRAYGHSSKDSDWDYLICVQEELSFQTKAAISSKIQTILSERLISVDIIIKSQATILKERNNVGFITYYAIKDGIPV